MAFRGTYDHSLDAKNRLTVPAKFRAQLAEGVVLVKALEPCVQIWTPAAFDAYVQEALGDAPRLSERYRKLNRYFSGNAHDTELDGAGRIGLPGWLLDHAGLKKECMIIGSKDCLEIWDRQAWQRYNDDLTGDVNDIAALLES